VDGLRGKLLTLRIPITFRSRMLFVVMVVHSGLFLDGGSENLDMTKTLLEHYKIQNTVISVHHPQTNGLVERGDTGLLH